ncbi:M13 family metallopeptidase [Stakelama saccharophila]|uniref:M13 family metallopeptidase n=1 Tax=Stakelama saccharophila TaxID=3075605 RepID=A0ABZ0B6K7_9SPHN|nr:M13 family metallopeptidase [Stakelama sp. W311]WNO52877.1 M13 family metallopeptidase [Stakelama sp. W311]
MHRSLLSVVLLTTTAMLAGCATTASNQSAALDDASAPLEKAAVDTVKPQDAPAPQIGTFGFDEAGMDRAVAPGNDFYDYANGAWQKKTEIPADRASYGLFAVLSDLSEKRTRGILEDAAKQGDDKIGVAYSTYLDRAAINAKGLAPIQPWLGRIEALNSRADYPALLAAADRNGVSIPFGSYVGQDDKQPDVYAMRFFQGGLGLPDRDYYLNEDAKFAEVRQKYVAHVAKMLSLAGYDNAQARAQAIMDLETGFAKVHWTRAESRDSNKTYNKRTLAELQRETPGFDFAQYLKAAGADVNSVIVSQPSAIEGEAKLIASTPVSVLKDQLLVRSLEAYADVLPEAFDTENFAFYGTVLSGTPEQRARWKRAVSFTEGALPDDISKIYVAKYFPPETKAAADDMVRNIIAAMGRRIDKLDWMSPETKQKAHEKLAAFTPKIGYPSRWHDYSSLVIRPGDAFGNNLRANQWHNDYNINKLGKPIYKWEWGMTPMTINAYANPGMVEIVFPAAILQPPFFDPNADPAVNYGGIGAVIGHELSHHFDDQGSQYNAEGRLVSWWTPADRKAFEARTDALVKQYEQYEPLPGMKVRGKLTLGENIADLAGLTVAHDAYMASLGGKAPPVIDGFTADQRFYLGWAQVWRRKYREENLRQRLLTDPHSPSHERVWVVRNLDPWYDAYDVGAGAGMYLAPDNRVKIW